MHIEYDTPRVREMIGSALRKARQRKGMTQTDAAVDFFGSENMQGHWSRWETGDTIPNWESLPRLRRWAGVSWEDFGFSDPPGGPTAEDIREAKELLRRALNLLGEDL